MIRATIPYDPKLITAGEAQKRMEQADQVFVDAVMKHIMPEFNKEMETMLKYSKETSRDYMDFQIAPIVGFNYKKLVGATIFVLEHLGYVIRKIKGYKGMIRAHFGPAVIKVKEKVLFY